LLALSVINTSLPRGQIEPESSEKPLQGLIVARLIEETAKAVADVRIGL